MWFLNILYVTVQSLTKFYVIILTFYFAGGGRADITPKTPASYGLGCC